MALHFAPVIQSNVLFKYLDDAKDIKPVVIGVDCKFESCELHWVQWGSRLQRSCITRERHTWLPDSTRTLHKIAIEPKAQRAVVAIRRDIEIG